MSEVLRKQAQKQKEAELNAKK